MKKIHVAALLGALALSGCVAPPDPLRFARAAALGAVDGVKAEAGLAIDQSGLTQLLAVQQVCMSSGSGSIGTVYRVDIPSLDITGEEFCARVAAEVAERVLAMTEGAQ
ncbi:MAG: hypothetical protein AAFQ81_05675 [Pseudomonadota bacterium]